MKSLIKLLLMASFAVVVFFRPAIYGLPFGAVLYWGLFVLMGLLVVAFYFTSYWVSAKEVEQETGKPVGFSLFVGQTPIISDDDLVRGRLVIDSSNVTLYKRVDGKERTSGRHCKEVWSIPVGDISSIGTGAIISIRKGLILYLEDGGEAKFICRKALKRKAEIIKALGWDSVPDVSPGFGVSVDVEGPATKAKSFSEVLTSGVSDESKDTDTDEELTVPKKHGNKRMRR
ncbi:MAG: hypothetical protein SPD11_15190 [Sphaerochaetaceae bacterium]|nr:hypothetical protein [Sphaerochaetaceae bacterium]